MRARRINNIARHTHTAERICEHNAAHVHMCTHAHVLVYGISVFGGFLRRFKGDTQHVRIKSYGFAQTAHTQIHQTTECIIIHNYYDLDLAVERFVHACTYIYLV